MGIALPWSDTGLGSDMRCASRSRANSPLRSGPSEHSNSDSIAKVVEADDGVEESEEASTTLEARAPSRDSHSSSLPSWPHLYEGLQTAIEATASSELWAHNADGRKPSAAGSGSCTSAGTAANAVPRSISFEESPSCTDTGRAADADDDLGEAAQPCPLARLYSSLVNLLGDDSFDHSSCDSAIDSGRRSPEFMQACIPGHEAGRRLPASLPSMSGQHLTSNPLASTLVPLGGLGQPICALRGRHRSCSAPAAGVERLVPISIIDPLMLSPFCRSRPYDGVGFGVVAPCAQGPLVRSRRSRSVGHRYGAQLKM